MMPCLRIGYGTLHCPTPFRMVQSPFFLCVCCHSIVGLGVCLCGRVVSLWNSGDGLCWVEGRVVSTVYRPLSTLVCCGVRVVLLCCVVGCEMAVSVGVVSLLVFLFPLSFSSSLCCWCSG